jgi:putative membrane protein
MIRREWQKLLKNKILLIVMIAIIAIPTIYTTLFLGSMWDPYGKLDNLPVAVVNEDKEVLYGDTELSVGKDLIENLKENNSLAFNFVDSNVANLGLENGTYYMVITIPENFSLNAATLMDDNPQKMELKYAINPGKNYIASKMSESAVAKIKDSIETEVTKVYARTMFEQITGAGGGMIEASEGAGKLYDGLSLITEGIDSYTDGVKKVALGSSDLASNNDALNQGVNSLSSGMKGVKGGSKQLVNGLNTMSDTIGSTIPKATDIDALGKGLDTYNAGIKQLNNELSNLSLTNQGESISNSLTKIGNSTKSAAKDVESIGNAVATLSKANLTKEQLLALQTIVNSTTELGGYLNSIGTETKSVGNNFTTLASSMSKLDDFKNAIGSLAKNGDTVLGGSKMAISGLYSGLSSVKGTLDSKIIPGGESLYQGISKMQTAIDKENGLKDSISSYTAAVAKIHEGMSTLDSKSSELQNGVKELNDGSIELTKALSDGAKEINEVKITDETIDMFASPVELEGTQVTEMENNGHAMAVYMMSVALWVACIAFCIMYPLTEYEGELKSGLAWYASKASVIIPVAVAQALVMIFMLNLLNGFSPQEMGKTIFIACLASLAFMSIMYFFNVCFGKVGSFAMLIYMVVQLAGSAGTYPIELSGNFVGKIHKFLPFSYTVEAFRSTISGGGSIKNAVIVLTTILVIFTVFTIQVFQVRAKRIRKGKPIIYDALEKGGLA